MTRDASTSHRVARLIPLVGILAGMTLILGSIALFFERDSARVLGAATGIVALLGAVWYASHPFLTSTRRYVRLRVEVGGFIGLVRELNRAAVGGAPAAELQSAKQRLHDAVERIAAVAGEAS